MYEKKPEPISDAAEKEMEKSLNRSNRIHAEMVQELTIASQSAQTRFMEQLNFDKRIKDKAANQVDNVDVFKLGL